jgi:uncharacterized hydrophobic protein (TIGR00271 family)
VFAAICEGGQISGRYVMMSGLAAAIATLGLLLSSPAVVIGAMLLSPLMGPIILLGFAFWTIDWNAARRAATSLALGLGFALAVAVVLTWVSPLKEPTAEILARTRPNLFDLLVAAFSGIAGGYAVIRQRGETVIGVAIATALMPPIATVGFGLGTANWTITLGAVLLFATNLIAIALAAAGMAAVYGFRAHLASRGWLGNGLVIVLLGVLCVPLTVSLNTIALESRATSASRAMIREIFGSKARLSSLSVRSIGPGLQVDGLVATPKYVGDASSQIRARLQQSFGKAAEVNMDQVVLADPSKLQTPSTASPALDPILVRMQALRDMVPFPSATVAYDPKLGKGVVLLAPQDGLDVAAARALEQGLRSHKGFENAQVIPPVQPLPQVPIKTPNGGPVQFEAGLPIIIWAMDRWGVVQAQALVCGLTVREAGRAGVQAALQERLGAGRVGAIIIGGRECDRSARDAPYLQLSPS